MEIIEKIKEKIKGYTLLGEVSIHSSGTEALHEILSKIEFKKNDYLLIPEFCCERILLPLFNLGINFEVLKSDNIFDINLESYTDFLKKDINIKAILLVHSYGYVNKNLIPIINMAKSNNILIIEDIAGAFGLNFEGRKLGTYGDYTFGSFGHDKLSSVNALGFSSLKRNDTLRFTSPNKNIKLNYNFFIKQIRKIKFKTLRFFLLKTVAIFLKNFCYSPKIDLQKLKELNEKLDLYYDELEIRKLNTSSYLRLLPESLQPNNDERVLLRVMFSVKTGKMKDELVQCLRKNKYWIGDDFALTINSWMKNYYIVDKHLICLITNKLNTQYVLAICNIICKFRKQGHSR